ncbi:MAG: LysR family transcriptional regulator [Deltaproteobacteria bacterium]|nr:LysR family transcriptional regulator [Deltaproteobacteria bacterium]
MHETHLTSLDLNLLVAFDVLLDECNVTRAAKRLHLSQPALSRTLDRLRTLFDDALLIKEGRGMAPSARALALREPVKLILQEIRAVLQPPVPFDPRSSSREFRIVSSDYAQVVVMGSVMQTLGSLAPNMTIGVSAPSDKTLPALAAGEADLLIGPPAFCPPWCDMETLLADAWACVRRAGRPMPKTPETFAKLAHVEVETERYFGSPVDVALGARGLRRPIRLRVSDFAGALFVVESSDLIATVPRPVALRGAQAMSLAVGRVPFELASPTVAMIWPKRMTSDAAHGWLRSTVRETVAALEAQL